MFESGLECAQLVDGDTLNLCVFRFMRLEFSGSLEVRACARALMAHVLSGSLRSTCSFGNCVCRLYVRVCVCVCV